MLWNNDTRRAPNDSDDNDGEYKSDFNYNFSHFYFRRLPSIFYDENETGRDSRRQENRWMQRERHINNNKININSWNGNE